MKGFLVVVAALASVVFFTSNLYAGEYKLEQDSITTGDVIAGGSGGLIGTATSGTGVVALLSSLGIPGLSGPGIMTALATIGGWFGGGAVVGVVALSGGSAIVIVATAAGTYKLYKIGALRRAWLQVKAVGHNGYRLATSWW